MLSWKEYREIRKTQFGENRTDSKWNYNKMYVPAMKSKDCCPTAVLAPLPKALCPCVEIPFGYSPGEEIKKQGNTPMMKSTSTSTDVTINTQAIQSDASKARDFLMSEFADRTTYSWRDEAYPKLRKLFNIDAPTAPTTSQGIIDAFKNGKVVIDQAKVDKQTAYFAALKGDEDSDDAEDLYESGIGSKYFGITFTDLPVADPKGYSAAVEAYEKLKTDTRRKIAILDPEAGLEVLAAFEAWQTTPATATAH